MPRRHLIVLVAVVTLSIPSPSQAKSGKELLTGALGSGLSSGASWGAQFALNALAGGLYTGLCNEGQVVDAAGELLCSVAGGITGKDEEKWRAEVDAKLEALQGQLEQVLKGQEEIQAAISRQGATIRNALDGLPTKLRVHDDLANIQNAWSAYTEFFRDMEPRKPAEAEMAIRTLAKDLLHNPRYNVEASARDLRVAIVDGAAGNPPLPLLLAREIDTWNRAALKQDAFDFLYPQDLDIRPHYAELELAMQQWMLRQKQAQVMYLWAARALDGTADAPRASAGEYGKGYFLAIESQVESFQRAVEWLVLASSFPRSPYANFLPKGADEVFARADAIEALQLSAPVGVGNRPPGHAIWGRVISMGNSFNPVLMVAAPGKAAGNWWPTTKNGHQVALKGFDSLDWWTATYPGQPLTYDAIHFGKAWTVYRYRYPLEKESPMGTYTVSASGVPIPFLTEKVNVENSLREITGGVDLYFGSTLGIARAGGAYALFSGEFTEDRSETLGVDQKYGKIVSWRVRSKAVNRDRGTMPRVVVAEKATARQVDHHTSGLPRRDVAYSVDRLARMTLTSKKLILSPEASSLKLHVLWNEDPLGVQAVGEAGDRAVVMINDWGSAFGALEGKAEYSARAGVTLGDPIFVPNRKASGLVLRRTGSNDRPEVQWEARTTRQHDVVPVNLSGVKHLRVEAEVHLKLPTARNTRSWTMLAKTSFQTVYLTR